MTDKGEKYSLDLKGLSIGYDTPIIKDIMLGLRPGTITTLIGPNGSGKSTLLKTLAGVLRPMGGRVSLIGRDMAKMSGTDIAKSLSIVMTEVLRPELMTCREMVETGRYPYTGRLGLLTDDDRAAVNEAMELMDISDISDNEYRQISDGQRQRVMLARAICQDTAILLLDEPTSYLDIRYRIDIIDKIRKAVDKRGLTVLMSLHELETAMRVSDRVVAISPDGTYTTGTPAEIFKEGFIRKLYGMEDVDIDILGTKPWYDEDHVQPNRSDENDGVSAGKSTGETEDVCALPVADDVTGRDQKNNKAKVIMVQGTMSGVGKSLIVAGLCRIFAQDGLKVAPFKSQNMALNSYVTKDGSEIGRAQAMQAEAAGIEPSVYMNPILLKPNSDTGSQVIVMGKPVGDMAAREYFDRKKELIPDIMRAYKALKEEYDVIVIEGAGSPAEINLKSHDIVNMGMAAMADAPVLLVGDIDRGGVFAQLFGTLDLLTKDERNRVKGLIINKFRGDSSLLDSGIDVLEKRGGVPVAGLVPYMNVRLEDEDSISERLGTLSKTEKANNTDEKAFIDIAVIRLRRMSNYTDMDIFEQFNAVRLRYVSNVQELNDPDMIILPGSKNTIEDLDIIKEAGLAKEIIRLKEKGCLIFGICGGMQMLGRYIYDNPEDRHRDDGMGRHEGLNLLPVYTVMGYEKELKQISSRLDHIDGRLSGLSGMATRGYEIHEGRTFFEKDDRSVSGVISDTDPEGASVYGTYIHGIFDEADIAGNVISSLAENKGITVDTDHIYGYREYKEMQYRRLADVLRESLDMDLIYDIAGINRGE